MNIYIQCRDGEEDFFNVAAYTVIKNTSKEVSIFKLNPKTLRESKLLIRPQDELARYFIPHMQKYNGLALFLDCYNYVNIDVYDLIAAFNTKTAIGVPEDNEKQPFLVFNCENYHNHKKLFPNMINSMNFNRHPLYFWIPKDEKFIYHRGWTTDSIVFNDKKDDHFSNLLKESKEEKTLFGLIKKERKLNFTEVNEQTIPQITSNQCGCGSKK